MRKLLCWLGWHKWGFSFEWTMPSGANRVIMPVDYVCVHCGKERGDDDSLLEE